MIIKNMGATDSGLRALAGVVLLGISASSWWPRESYAPTDEAAVNRR